MNCTNQMDPRSLFEIFLNLIDLNISGHWRFRKKNDPDAVFVNIRYHLAWNVVHRRSLFPEPQNAFEVVNDAFFDSGSAVGSFVSLLWLAPDHVHVYLESDGEEPVETIAQEIKRISESSIFVRASEMGSNTVAGNYLWDKAYFAETIG